MKSFLGLVSPGIRRACVNSNLNIGTINPAIANAVANLFAGKHIPRIVMNIGNTNKLLVLTSSDQIFLILRTLWKDFVKKVRTSCVVCHFYYLDKGTDYKIYN